MRFLLYFMAFWQFFFSWAPTTWAAQANPPLPDPRFGLTEAFWLPDEAAELRVGWERILFYWREIQPTGPDDWNTLHVLEEWLDAARADGRMVVGLLKNTAPWASEDRTEAGLPKGLYLPDDDPGNLWANFVRKIAAYYGPLDVHHWIIWNEPEISPGTYGYEFAGSAADYYQLLKVAYRVMKAEDPGAIIHLAGLTWWHDQSFLGRLLEIAVNDPEGQINNYFFDVISLHIYFRTETVKTIISAVQNVQKTYGMDKPIWINETNAPPNQDPLWPVQRPVFEIDLEQQAWFITQAIALGFAHGAESISVYKLLDIHLPPGGESYGLLRPDLSRRPAYDTYKQLSTYLNGFTDVMIQQNATHYLISFHRPIGVTHIAWARTQAAVTIQFHANLDRAQIIRVPGDIKPITPVADSYEINLEGARCQLECIVGGRPVIVVEQEQEQTQELASGLLGLLAMDSQRGLAETPAIVQENQNDPEETLTPQATPVALTPFVENSDLNEVEDGSEDHQMVSPNTNGSELKNSEIPAAQINSIKNRELDFGLWFIVVGLTLGVGIVVYLRYAKAR